MKLIFIIIVSVFAGLVVYTMMEKDYYMWLKNIFMAHY